MVYAKPVTAGNSGIGNIDVPSTMVDAKPVTAGNNGIGNIDVPSIMVDAKPVTSGLAHGVPPVQVAGRG